MARRRFKVQNLKKLLIEYLNEWEAKTSRFFLNFFLTIPRKIVVSKFILQPVESHIVPCMFSTTNRKYICWEKVNKGKRFSLEFLGTIINHVFWIFLSHQTNGVMPSFIPKLCYASLYSTTYCIFLSFGFMSSWLDCECFTSRSCLFLVFVCLFFFLSSS